MKIRYAFLTAVLVALLVVLGSVSVMPTAFASAEYEIRDVDGEVEYVGNKQFYNAKDGCDINIYFTAEAYANIEKVVYEAVKLSSIVDTVNVDETNVIKLSDGQEKLTDSPVTVKKEDFRKKDSSNRYYFTLSTKVNCAYVFTVYVVGEEEPYYGTSLKNDERTNVVYCTRIDGSNPTAYAEFDYFDSGNICFKVTVKGNVNKDKHFADSGIKAFSVIKSLNGKETVVDEVTSVGQLYYYNLKVDQNEIATYYLDIIDNVGNATRSKVMEMNTDTDDVTTACDRVIDRLEELDYYEDFSPYVLKRLKNARAEYYVALQNGTTTAEELQSLASKCAEVMGEIKDLEEKKENNLADITLKNYNTEYLGGKIKLENSYGAPILYGDRGVMTITVAELSLDRVDKTAEMEAGKVKEADYVLAITTELSVEEDIVVAQSSDYMKLVLPKVFSEKIVCVQTADVEGGKEYIPCEYVVGKDYTEVFVLYSTGTLNVFVGVESSFDYLYLLFIIPAVAIVAVAVILIVKKPFAGKINKKKKKDK